MSDSWDFSLFYVNFYLTEMEARVRVDRRIEGEMEARVRVDRRQIADRGRNGGED